MSSSINAITMSSNDYPLTISEITETMSPTDPISPTEPISPAEPIPAEPISPADPISPAEPISPVEVPKPISQEQYIKNLELQISTLTETHKNSVLQISTLTEKCTNLEARVIELTNNNKSCLDIFNITLDVLYQDRPNFDKDAFHIRSNRFIELQYTKIEGNKQEVLNRLLPIYEKEFIRKIENGSGICSKIMVRGDRKGQMCGKKANGAFCGAHAPKTAEKVYCTIICQTGVRTGLPCTSYANGTTNLCNRHSKPQVRLSDTKARNLVQKQNEYASFSETSGYSLRQIAELKKQNLYTPIYNDNGIFDTQETHDTVTDNIIQYYEEATNEANASLNPITIVINEYQRLKRSRSFSLRIMTEKVIQIR